LTGGGGLWIAWPMHTSRINLTALLVGLTVAAAGFMFIAPGAKAATPSCDAGEFCMWYLNHAQGGLYEWSGNDSTLANDHFEIYNTGSIVNNNTESAYNRGVPAYYDDVRAYDGLSYTGSSRCFPRGQYVSDLGSWNNRISSFKWVHSC
jgi:Peptidase inhibitor family I36